MFRSTCESIPRTINDFHQSVAIERISWVLDLHDASPVKAHSRGTHGTHKGGPIPTGTSTIKSQQDFAGVARPNAKGVVSQQAPGVSTWHNVTKIDAYPPVKRGLLENAQFLHDLPSYKPLFAVGFSIATFETGGNQPSGGARFQPHLVSQPSIGAAAYPSDCSCCCSCHRRELWRWFSWMLWQLFLRFQGVRCHHQGGWISRSPWWPSHQRTTASRSIGNKRRRRRRAPELQCSEDTWRFPKSWVMGITPKSSMLFPEFPW